MALRTVPQLIRDAVIATAIPNLVWTYLSWRYRLRVGTIYVWPWVLIDTLLYAYRADKLGLNSSFHGIAAYDRRSIRVGAVPFLAAIGLPLFNFAFSRQAPVKSLPIVLLASGASWSVHDLMATLSRLRQEKRL